MKTLPSITVDPTPDVAGLGRVVIDGLRHFGLPPYAVHTLARALPTDEPALAKRVFENESDSAAVGDMTVENRLDRVEFYGALTITLDREGEALLAKLESLVAGMRRAFDAQSELPEKIVSKAPGALDNPAPAGQL